MATWGSERFDGDVVNDGSLDNILGSRELQNCLEDSLDLDNFNHTQLFTLDKYSDDEANIADRLRDDNTGSV